MAGTQNWAGFDATREADEALEKLRWEDVVRFVKKKGYKLKRGMRCALEGREWAIKDGCLMVDSTLKE